VPLTFGRAAAAGAGLREGAHALVASSRKVHGRQARPGSIVEFMPRIYCGPSERAVREEAADFPRSEMPSLRVAKLVACPSRPTMHGAAPCASLGLRPRTISRSHSPCETGRVRPNTSQPLLETISLPEAACRLGIPRGGQRRPHRCGGGRRQCGENARSRAVAPPACRAGEDRKM